MDRIFYFNQINIYKIDTKFYICDSLIKTKPRGILIEISGIDHDGIWEDVYIFKQKVYKDPYFNIFPVKIDAECEDGFINGIQLMESIKNKYFTEKSFVLYENEDFKFYKFLKEKKVKSIKE